MNLKLKPALILAWGECLAISAALDYEELPIPPVVAEAVERLYRGEPIAGGLRVEDLVLVYTIIYGGLILSYTCDPVTPISRAHIAVGLEIGGASGGRRVISDNEILKAWALIYSGREAEGLDLVKGVSYYPWEVEWKPGGSVRILPVAVIADATSSL